MRVHVIPVYLVALVYYVYDSFSISYLLVSFRTPGSKPQVLYLVLVASELVGLVASSIYLMNSHSAFGLGHSVCVVFCTVFLHIWTGR